MLTAMSLFRTSSPDALRACLRVLDGVGRGEIAIVTWHSLSVLLEDERLGAPDEDVWEALLRSGVFLEVGGCLVAQPGVSMADLFDETSPRDQQTVAVTDLAAFLSSDPRSAVSPSGTSLASVAEAINRVQTWGLECLDYAAREDLAGFPVFWTCRRGKHLPFGTDYGSMSASETVLLWAEGFRYGVSLPETGWDGGGVENAWSRLLALGNAPDAWHAGAIHLSTVDDDFVGSWMPSNADAGSCPTTDGTAQRLYALCQLVIHCAGADRSGELRSLSHEKVCESVRCLLRWQAEAGAWSIHRYPPTSRVRAPVRDVSTWYASEALLCALASGLLDASLDTAVRTALGRLADFLVDRAKRSGAEVYWNGDFTEADECLRFRATTLVAQYCGGLAEVVGSDRLADLHTGAIAYLEARWTPDRSNVLHINVRVPTWSGLATDSFSWAVPADPLVVVAMLDWAARGAALSGSLRNAIGRATAEILAHESHGHWPDVAVDDLAMVANTLRSLRALLAIAAWQVSLMPKTITSGLIV